MPSPWTCTRTFAVPSSNATRCSSPSPWPSRFSKVSTRLILLNSASSSQDPVETSKCHQTQQSGSQISIGLSAIRISTACRNSMPSRALTSTSSPMKVLSKGFSIPTSPRMRISLENGIPNLTHSRKWSSWRVSVLIRSPLLARTTSVSTSERSLSHLLCSILLALSRNLLSLLLLFSFCPRELILTPVSKDSLLRWTWPKSASKCLLVVDREKKL